MFRLASRLLPYFLSTVALLLLLGSGGCGRS